MANYQDELVDQFDPNYRPMNTSPADPRMKNLGAQGAPPPIEAPEAAPPPVEAPKGLGQYSGKLEGFDQGKLDSGHDSPKYQFARVFSRYDPKGGVTPEMLAELNALGLGTVTGQGDKINVGGNVDPRFEGVTSFDVIRDLENGGGWQWGDASGGGGGGQRRGVGGGMPNNAVGQLHSLLQGSPAGNIQAALGQYGQQSDYLKQLLAQLNGG